MNRLITALRNLWASVWHGSEPDPYDPNMPTNGPAEQYIVDQIAKAKALAQDEKELSE